MQLGFVIDHSRCIGCHACTVACKSENDVPVGSFRTWVKYTETGSYPEVRRHFAVLRCNQCSDAPCMTICPTGALHKRDNGIVDVRPDLCIGCKSCMQGCPYDALYINPSKGTAEKCHFCAHRVERGLAPACAVVCPTEAIIPGDFDDPQSVVSHLKAAGGLVARKLEAGTRPNVWYREVDASGVQPLETSGAGGYLWAARQPGAQLDAELAQAVEQRAAARTVYDVDREPMWGWRVSAYLWTKAIAAGAFLVGYPTVMNDGKAAVLTTTIAAMLFLLVTTVLLVADLKKPERFLLILLHPNWRSWVARGAVALTAFGALLAAWIGLAAADALPELATGAHLALGLVTCAFAALTAAYTAWLFQQAKGRVLWTQRLLPLHLLVHAVVAGCGLLYLLAPWLDASAESVRDLRAVTIAALVLYLALDLARGRLAPKGREREYERAHAVLTRGPWAMRHKLGLVVGVLIPLALVVAAPSTAPVLVALPLLAGLWLDGDVWVKAGQALRIS